MDPILGQILRQAVWERLDMLDELAANADGPSLASVARTELPRLTDGWRVLLKAHEPDAKGNCPTCSSRWRPQKAPCTVWQAAHAHLVTPEHSAPSPVAAPTPHRASHSRPRAVARPAIQQHVRAAQPVRRAALY